MSNQSTFYRGTIIQKPNSGLITKNSYTWPRWKYCCTIVHDPETNVTYAFVLGLIASERENVIGCLLSTHDDASDCALLPTCILQLSTELFYDNLRGIGRILEDVVAATGMTKAFEDADSRDVDSFDLSKATKTLTRLMVDIANLQMRINTYFKFNQVIEDLHDQVYHSQQASLPQSTSTYHRSRQRLSIVRQVAEGIEEQLRCYKGLAQALVQTIYSLVGQRDNERNIEAAQVSQQIAKDSRKVAILTRKDSTDMRIIAAVTLVFLPGTFVASFFSTTFFNFQSSAGNSLVSRWFYLYWMVTFLLTIVVLCAWYYFAKRQTKQMAAIFSPEDEMRQQTFTLSTDPNTEHEPSDQSAGNPPKPRIQVISNHSSEQVVSSKDKTKWDTIGAALSSLRCPRWHANAFTGRHLPS